MYSTTQMTSFSCTALALAVAASLSPATVLAQESGATVETVIVTGSAIRRIRDEGTLPVQTLEAAEISRLGASSVVDLLQKLPVVQGGTLEASAVGGETFGFAGVSLHDIGETRTLVLLNGRRMAQFGGQTLTGFAAAIDLNSIPIAAIERVEVLTDGASAIYGSDAIAGVVNFITKKNTTETFVNVSYHGPEDGAREWGASASTGFGDYDRDGWNLFVALSADKRNKLTSTDRPFARTGFVDFNHNGRDYRFINDSPSPIPANIFVLNDDSELAGQVATLSLLQGGSCAEGTGFSPFWGDYACGYDYVQSLEIYPIRERKTAMTSLNAKLGGGNLFADLLWSESDQESAIAPVPGSFVVLPGSPIWDQYIEGLTGPDGVPVADDFAFLLYRVYDLGNRRTFDNSKFYNAAVGFESAAAGWDYSVGVSQSESKVKGSISGYPGTAAFSALLNAGLLDPFLLPGQQSAAGQAGLDAINYRGYWNGGTSRLQALNAQGSRELLQFNNGNSLMLAVGASYQREKFQSKPSEFAQANLDDPVAGTPAADGPGTGDQRFGDAAAYIPYSADRNVWSVFGELSAQLTDSVELTGAVRFDDYSDVGSTVNGKIGIRVVPTQGLLLRGSVGTGFKAPTVPQLNAALQSYGVTAVGYPCTAELQQVANEVGAQCRPGNSQYDVFAGGNPDLEPETSTQFSLGFVFEPSPSYSFGADYWWVDIDDAFGQISESEAFGNPLRYHPGSWTSAVDPGTGINFLAYNAGNLNLGEERISGIDLNGIVRFDTPIGALSSQVVATYMLSRKVEILGETFEPIGNYSGELGYVAFRWKGRWVNSLSAGNWTHSAILNFSSGYTDAEQFVDDFIFEVDGSGQAIFGGETSGDSIRLKVDPYYTVDWQSNWNVTESLAVTLGVLNLFDKDPPLTLALDGGHPVGYDLRYYDPRGRTLYGKVSFRF